MDRVILHCDINSFFASVELLDHPELQDVPVAVSGDPQLRHGIILAKNQVAKSYGIVTAETVWQAKRKCPDLVLLPPHHDKYRDFSQRLNRIYQEYTDMVEPFSIDESWLDVTASQSLFGSGREIADKIRSRVREELGITLSAGVSYNKIFAKMGSEYKKPDATTEITRDNYQSLLWPMPIQEMFFVGYATSQRLEEAGIHTIGDLAQSNPQKMESLLGKQGPMLRSYARGEDDAPVRYYDQKSKIKSVGNGITFRRNLVGKDDILTGITGLADTVASRLRQYQLKASGVKVDLKDPQLKTVSRQTRLPYATNLSEDLRKEALALILGFWPAGKPIRLITLTAIGLEDENGEEQLSLFQEENHGREKSESVERTMDAIRQKFGDSAIGFGQTLDNDIGIDL